MLRPNGKKLTSSLLILFMLLSLFPASILAVPSSEYFDPVTISDDPAIEDTDTAIVLDDPVTEDIDAVIIPDDPIEENFAASEPIAAAPSSADIWTVTFDSAGGTAKKAIKVNDGDPAIKPTDPTKTGFDFDGWFLKGSDELYDFDAPVSANITLMAQWSTAILTIDFDTADGTQIDPVDVEYGAKLAKPEDPQREGYTFAGWLKGSTAYNFSTAVKTSFTLKAKWTVITYTVKFDSAGGTAKASAKVNHGNSVTKPSNPTKAGFAFLGWYLDDDPYDFTTPVTENITLKAGWSDTVCLIEFDTAGGSLIDPVEVDYGAKLDKPEDPQREGYTFAGWLKGTTTYNFSTAVKSSFTLKAKWTVITYTVKFDSAGGTAKSSIKVNHGNKVAKPSNPTKAGFTFMGWFLDGSDDPYDFTTPVTENITLQAQWIDTICLIEFDTAGGTLIDPVEIAYGEKLDKPEDPQRDGYIFGGWLKGSTTYNFNTVVKTSFTLKAKWTAITYKVTFDSDGGTAKASVKVNEGATLKKPTNPIKTGYAFEGWYLDGTDELYDFDTPVYEDIILMAQWSRKYFEIKFDSAGGTEIDSVTVEYGQKIERPEDPQRDGYTFGGWYKGLVIYNFGSPVTAEFTIKAKWNPITYTVTFDANGGTARVPAKVNEGNKVAKPANPTKPGYTFLGWYLDGTDELYDFNTPVYENIVLEAQWSQKFYEIAFDTSGGSPQIESVTLEYGQKLVRPEDPEREGYTFVCWMKGVLPYSFTLPVTESFTLKAKWNPIVYLVSYDTQGAIPKLPVAVKHGELVTRPTNPVRLGYTFDGWYLNGSNTPYDFRTPLTGSITLTAHWIKK